MTRRPVFLAALVSALAAVAATVGIAQSGPRTIPVSEIRPGMRGYGLSVLTGTEPERFERMVFVGASPRYLNDTGYVGGFDQSDINALYSAMSSNYQAWASGFSGLVMGYPERPELAAEGELALVVEALVVEHQHAELIHSGMDGRHLFIRERAGEVDT